jgi:putative DNA primase/helicase
MGEIRNMTDGPRKNGSDAELALRQIKAGAEQTILEPPSNPMACARQLAREHMCDGTLTLRAWRGGWWTWRRSHWTELQPAETRMIAYAFTEKAVYRDDKDNLKPWSPTQRKVSDLLDALAAVCHLPDNTAQPSWIDGRREHDGAIVACTNGLLDVAGRKLIDSTPIYFNTTSVPFAYDQNATAPRAWLGFLTSLWPDDRDQVQALREFMGYVISGRTDLHKILLIVGPTRAGKGVIARTLEALVGRGNVAGPTLSSLSGEFGLAPLLGKSLAVISDARLGGRDSNIVVERLLSVSGEDMLTVNRKHRDQWTGKLPARFLICSNELPRLGDASAAIASRFVTLILDQSFYGREDKTLEGRIRDELPGILCWALDGLERLVDQGAFTRPASTVEAYVALQDLASPVGAFVRERCVIGSDHQVLIPDLWAAWKQWCEDNGHGRGGTRQTFGRDLRAAVPRLRVSQPRGDDGRQHPLYEGIGLKEPPA